MGYSDWSDAAYRSRQTHRAVTGTTAFTYDSHVRSTGNVEVHPQMNPYKVVRESRDSDQHPDSVSIGVMFDVTGSMASVPRVLQTKLGALMRLLIQRGYVEHPQILFGAIGDAFCDRVPLQVGQFESGLEMDDELGKIYLEGGGGGQVYESYELAMYFFARHTSIDCYEKRGKKGYLFTIGDEKPYPFINREQAEQLLGDKLEADLPIARVLEELLARYEYFHIIPTNTYHGKDPAIQEHWRSLLGERVLMLDDESAVCETIALAIGLCEDAIYDLAIGADELVSAGYDATAASAATTALTSYAASRATSARVVSGLLPTGGSSIDDGRL